MGVALNLNGEMLGSAPSGALIIVHGHNNY